MKVPFMDFEGMHGQIHREMMAAFSRVYERNWFILGGELEAFESAYARFNDTRYAVGVSSGLDALHLALRALGIGKGDEVIVPSNTFIATALAVSFTGARPVFVEPDIRTYNMDPENIAGSITSDTRAVIPVHLYGQACEMDRIEAVAKRYHLYMVEDNAQAHGAEFKGKKTGSWGHINATSFYPGKNLGALGDGGAVTTDDEYLAKSVRLLRNYGSEVKYNHLEKGFNMRLDELQAAFLRVKLRKLAEWIEMRRTIASWYNEALAGVGDLILPELHQDASHVYHLYVIRSGYRDELQWHLKQKEIDTLIHYPVPPHLQRAYADLNLRKGQFPVAEKLADEVLSLPLWPGMSEGMVGRVASEIKKSFAKRSPVL